MTDNKPLNDRRRRERALREVLGDDVYRRNRDAVDNAEEVRQAARFIRQMREHAKLTQTALAQKLSVTQARISEIERGDSPEGVSYALLRRVAKACGFQDWPTPPVESIARTEMATRQKERSVAGQAEWATALKRTGAEAWSGGTFSFELAPDDKLSIRKAENPYALDMRARGSLPDPKTLIKYSKPTK